MTLLQATTDTGIHLTLGSGIAALLGKLLWDEFRGKNRNGNGKELRDLAENAKLQTTLLSQQTEILRQMSQDIAVVKDRTK